MMFQFNGTPAAMDVNRQMTQNITDHMPTSNHFLPFGAALGECSEIHEQLLCQVITKTTQKTILSQHVDLTNPAESGWIWASFGVFAPLCLFGIIGNLLTVIMFTKYIKKTTTSVFIIALAVVDLTVCTTSMPFYLYSLFDKYHGSELICKLDKFVYFLAIPLSGGILLAIAVERFILIFFAQTKLVTHFRAKLTVFFLFVGCLTLAIPQALSFTTLYTLDKQLVSFACNGSISCNTLTCRPTTEYIPQDVFYYMWQGLIVVFLLMVIVFTTMYSLIFTKVYSLHKKMLEWKKMRNQAPKQEKILADQPFTSAYTSDGKPAETNSTRVSGVVESSTPTDPTRATLTDNSGSTPDESANPAAKAGVKPALQSKHSVIPKKSKRMPHLHTALTLFLITIFYLVSYMPLILMMYIGSCEGKNAAQRFVNICGQNDYRRFVWHFFFFNHITNPIVYAFMNPRFRDAIHTCFKSWRLCRV